MRKIIILTILQIILLSAYFIFMFLDFTMFRAPFKTTVATTFLAILLFINGILIIFFGIIHLSTKSIKKKGESNSNDYYFSGIYEYIKHPIYAGILLCLLAYAIYVLCVVKFFISILLGIVLYYKSKAEDKIIESEYFFYKNYNKKTGQFFPKRKKKRRK